MTDDNNVFAQDPHSLNRIRKVLLKSGHGAFFRALPVPLAPDESVLVEKSDQILKDIQDSTKDRNYEYEESMGGFVEK